MHKRLLHGYDERTMAASAAFKSKTPTRYAMIQLTCPNCQTELEIDDGFAGGICRCFDCGTLMTVPADKTDRAEKLTRADRPDAPGEVAAPHAADEGGRTTLVTETGKRVELSEDQIRKAAVARKARVGVRVGVVVAFLVIFGGLAVLVGVLAMNLIEASRPDPGDPSAADIAHGDTKPPVDIATQFGYDPAVNPYQLDQPNIFQLPIDADTPEPIAILINGNSDWSAFIIATVERNLQTLDKLQAPPATRTFVAEDGQFDQALSDALAGEARRLIIIWPGRPFGRAQPMIEQIREADVRRVDVVQVETRSNLLADIAEAFEGEQFVVTTNDIRDWYAAVRDDFEPRR